MSRNENACLAAEAGDYYGFTGWILFGETDGYVEDADFTMEDVHVSGDHCYSLYGRDELIIFKKGRFVGGRLGFCVWLDGVFMNGIARYTVWRNGVFRDGVFNGVWFDGTFIKGEWRNANVVPQYMRVDQDLDNVNWLLDTAMRVY